MKKFVIKYNIQPADLEKMIDKGGYSVFHMQFMSDDKLNAVFVKECPDTPPVAAPAQAAAKRISTGTMPIVVIPQPSVPLTRNAFRNGDTRPLNPLRAEVQVRREKNEAELYAIAQKYIHERDEINRNFKPFQLGVK